MAAFCQDHGAGIRRLMPVAAYIAVRVVPVGHVLGMGDVHHVADDAGVDQLLELAVEFGIAHHMADHDLCALFLGAALQGQTFAHTGRDGLFQQDAVPQVDGLAGIRIVLAVLGADEHRVRHARPGEKLLRRLEHAFGGHMVILD